MKNEQQSQNLLLKVDPGSTLSNNFVQPATNVFVVFLRDKLITQGVKRETSTKNLKRNKFRVFVSRISPPLTRVASNCLWRACVHEYDAGGIQT